MAVTADELLLYASERRLLSNLQSIRRVNQISGVLLIGVGLAIGLG